MKRSNRSSRTPNPPGAEWLLTEGPKRKVSKTSTFDVSQRILHQQRLEAYFAATRDVEAASRALKTQYSDPGHLGAPSEKKRVASCTVVSGECDSSPDDSPPPLEAVTPPLQVANIVRESSAANATITSSYIATSQGPAHTITSADLAANQGPYLQTHADAAYFAPQEQNVNYFAPLGPSPTCTVPLRLTPTSYLLDPHRQIPNFGYPHTSPYFAGITQAAHCAPNYFAATQLTNTSYNLPALQLTDASYNLPAPPKKITGKKSKREAKQYPAVNPSIDFEQVQNEMLNEPNVTTVDRYDEFDIDNCNEDSLGLGEAVNEQEADVSLIVDFALGTNNRKTSGSENQELELDFAFDGL